MISPRFQTTAPIQFAGAAVEDVSVTEKRSAFERLVDVADGYADLHQWTPLSEIPGVQNARRFFRAIGVDPTKRRPSSEALLNRALKRKELYSVNTLVDVGNWCSLEFLLPTCAYDADKIAGRITVRLGREGESYAALNHREMDVAGRLVLADETGPFGSPMTDSLRTATSVQTTQAVVGIWAPQDYDRQQVQRQLEIYVQRVIDFCGGQRFSEFILSA